MTANEITIRTNGNFWSIYVDGKIADVAVKVDDRYRIYERRDPEAIKIAAKLGGMIGRRIVQTPKNDRQTTEAELRAAIAAAA